MLIGLDVVSGETTLFEWMLMPKRKKGKFTFEV
jgi:hypothetical protein